jgi:hypothetical protein
MDQSGVPRYRPQMARNDGGYVIINFKRVD